MSARRDQVLSAAIDTLAAAGPRGLTHRSVDAAAGVPPGTTSNHFRTRAALVDGVLEELAVVELGLFGGAAPRGPVTVDGVAEQLAALMKLLAGDYRRVSLARYAVFLDVLARPELAPVLVARTAAVLDIAEAVMTALGAREPRRSGRVVLACFDGLLSDQLLRPQAPFEPEPDLRRIIASMLS